MKALVIGGAGFIGSHTVDALIEKGFEVRILDKLLKPVHTKGVPKYLNSKAEFILGDICDYEILESALKDVNVVFNFAAYQDYLPYFSNFFQTNCAGNALIYEIAVKNKLKIDKIIVASSQFVNGEGAYEDIDNNLVFPNMRDERNLKKGIWSHIDSNGNKLSWRKTSESHSNPPNQYAISKYAQEMMSLNFGKRYEIPTTTLRYSIVQGERQSFYNTYSGALRIFSMFYNFGKPPIIYEDGNMIRDFVNIHDVVDANMMVLENPDSNFNTYNVGGGKEITIKDFCKIVAKVFKKEDLPLNIPNLYRFGDTRHAFSDISKIRDLGWEPKRSTDFSVQSYYDYMINSDIDESILEESINTMKKLNVVREVV
ncbi:MAG: NAD-dependent epimerase/dehydratase family protein [Flavobacteriaceae bacterium]|nr:NAD-dependent epimerase/dehydratase family protein [Flavobacteriaceae bacterium]MBL6685104.1 NAD-dependent epimerase/dehydratase family protein [Flavobacteriaceae bacterium]